MAVSISREDFSIAASADLSTKIYLVMTINSSAEMAVCNGVAAADPVMPDGVLCDKPDAQGKHGFLQTRGIAKVYAGAAVTKGAKVMVDANGKAVDYVDPGAGKSVYILGRALIAAANADEIVEVLLNIHRSDNAA